MTTSLLARLPFQILCNLIVQQQAEEFNATIFAVNQSSQPLVELAKLPNGETAVSLANLPLQAVCQLLLTSNFSIDENGTLFRRGITVKDYITQRPTPAVTLPEGYVIFPDDRAAYKMYKEPRTWYEARERCISEGARLAITDSIVKVAHINSLKTDWGNQWIHVGIYKSNTTDEWLRVDNNLSARPVPWLSNYPLNMGKCAGISFSREGLVDYGCNRPGEFFVCEIPIL